MSVAASLIPTQRAELLSRLAQPKHYDLAVVGGGATGLGVALDAAARGLRVVLLESHDFAKGSSSRATKLVHGGVRYLAQGNIGLVREALHERTILLGNAPNLAQALPFVIPFYHWWEAPFYGLGLKLYDALAGAAGLGKTTFLSREQTLRLLPTAQRAGLKGGVQYWDGQFDDARLALALARTAAGLGALLVNYCRVTDLVHTAGKVSGLRCQDTQTGQAFEISAACVVNAAGVWVDELRQRDGDLHGAAGATAALVAPSQGVHLVVERSFLPADVGLMVPKTADGRVLFVVPWLGRLILGTTDTPRSDLAREPLPFRQEIDFILKESARYLARGPTRADVKSVWVGLRPLVKPADDSGTNTKGLSREHTVLLSRSGLVTVTGGKWTTYRAMAEDVLRVCAAAELIPLRPQGLTAQLPLVGAQIGSLGAHPVSALPGMPTYGDEQALLMSLPGAGVSLGGGLTEAMVRFAARYEYALTVEDVLARRARLLFLDAALAASLAARVADILRQETGQDPKTDEFIELAQQYRCPPD